MQPDKFKLLYQLTFEGPWPTAVAFLGPRRVAAGNREGQIFVWDLPESPPEPASEPKDDKEREAAARRHAPTPTQQLLGHTNAISRLLATPDGKWLISASLDRSIRLWQADAPTTGTAEAVLDSETRKAEARRAGKKAEESPGVQVGTREADHVLQGHRDWVMALGLSADGSRLITGDGSAQVIVWDLGTRKELSRWSGHAWNWIVAAALSPDGQTALVSEFRYKRDDFDIPAAGLKLWNVADGKEKLDLLKIQFPKLNPADTSYGGAQPWRKFVADGLVAAAFSPDGKLVALGQGGETDTGKVHLLEVETGKLLRTVTGHQYGVTDVNFSADGKCLLSTGRDTTLRITSVDDGKELAALNKPRGGQFKDWLSALAISPDETSLAAADIAGLVHVWSGGSST
jgi:WD40 repeat protein